MSQPDSTAPLADRFAAAQARVKTLRAAPDATTLLALYSLFKQSSTGDVTGTRPGMMDFKGRAKHDAWAGRRGMTRDAAMTAYVELVDQLVAADGQ